MLNIPLIKYYLKKNLNRTIFSIIRNIYIILFKNFNFFYKKRNTKNYFFDKFKTINYGKVKFDIKIKSINGGVDSYIDLYGPYELEILDVISLNLEKGDVFVDVGSNIGHHSLYASALVGDKGKVISSEPIGKIFDQMSESIEKNNFKNLEVHNFGLGEEEEFLKINFSKDNMGSSSIKIKRDTNDFQVISIKNGDEILFSENRISLLKIDVEGFEFNVLKGMSSCLDKFKPKIILEYSPYLFELFDPKISLDMLNFLFNKGYYLYDIENKMQEILDAKTFLSAIQNKNIPQTNIFCSIHKQ
jgi:FkbM family methyltransferase